MTKECSREAGRWIGSASRRETGSKCDFSTHLQILGSFRKIGDPNVVPRRAMAQLFTQVSSSSRECNLRRNETAGKSKKSI